MPVRCELHRGSPFPSSPRRPSVSSAIVLVMMLAGTLLPWRTADARPKPATTTTPTFTLPAQSGEVSLSALRGKVVYVDFWASWCGPCRSSFPWMSGIAQRWHDRGLEVVAINLDKDRALADAFLAERLPATPAGFRVAFDPVGKTAESFRVAAMPTSFLIGRDGQMLVRHAGFDARHTASLEKQIEEALAR